MSRSTHSPCLAALAPRSAARGQNREPDFAEVFFHALGHTGRWAFAVFHDARHVLGVRVGLHPPSFQLAALNGAGHAWAKQGSPIQESMMSRLFLVKPLRSLI